jgi:antirestriction protein ArdC
MGPPRLRERFCARRERIIRETRSNVVASKRKGNHMITNLDRANWADKAIRHEGNRAYYAMHVDHVQMPLLTDPRNYVIK